MIGKLTEKLQFTDFNNTTNAKTVLFSITTSSRKDVFAIFKYLINCPFTLLFDLNFEIHWWPRFCQLCTKIQKVIDIVVNSSCHWTDARPCIEPLWSKVIMMNRP